MPDLNSLILENTAFQIIFNLFGGTALLMYGVDFMGGGLEKASGKVMRKILSILTKNIYVAFFVGTVLTMLVQSSTAITVMTVGFVNAGLMNLTQAVGIIYGTNIGTTITAQLMSLKLTHIALPVIAIGFFIMSFSKKDSTRNFGQALMGFGLMFLGLKTLNASLPYIQESETARQLFLQYGQNPFLGLFVGMIATMLIHSSAATVALTISLFSADMISFYAAVGLTLGDNIGTCVTAQLASLKANTAARRTAWAHTLYNVIGVVIAIIVLKPFSGMIEWITFSLLHEPKAFLVANTHTLFNIISALVFLPITKYYVLFLEKIIPDRTDKRYKEVPLDRLLIETPVAALKAATQEVINAADIAKDMLNDSLISLIEDNESKIDSVLQNEEKLNSMQTEITQYLVEISRKDLDSDQSAKIPALINTINNFERVGDHCEDITELSRNKINRKIIFSEQGINELETLYQEVMNMMDECLLAYSKDDAELALQAAAREDVVDELTLKFKDEHIRRLEEGTCSVQAGVIYLDAITHLERIADHLHNVCHIISEGRHYGDKE
ncbi:MAG TPA: Na/Pi cotransporter family protein [Bacillota bacterium]|jgi:phosphate:Na+ symporter|nr:Na/Pi cotransporter family protein [Bacillota bacterium]HQE66768.1 Na/Pi cotransporter family protein [Bacillota bacterium]HQI15585.1 Na/Pi cotransporter family protein [Bacillota bacterium]HQJ36704.1 Na/Pi cotransporter family protein [Bacillota bacterium]